jgi:thymidylate synthase
MTKVFLAVKQVLSIGVLIVLAIVFIGMSSVFIGQQPSYATTQAELKLIPPEYKPTPQEKINRAYEYDPGVGIQEEDRQKAYEQAIKDSKNLNTLEKAYERNLKGEQGQNQEGIIEKASDIIDQVTGK